MKTTPAALRTIYAVGLSCALLAVLTGFALERRRFGSSEGEALAEVQRSVQSQMASVFDSLLAIAGDAARDPRLFEPAAADPEGASARALFDRADAALRARPAGVFAVTMYRASGDSRPLAWSGRPSEIDPARLAAGRTFFVQPGPLGLRLVFITPVSDPATGRRVGVIAAERVLSDSRGIQAPLADVPLAIPSAVPVTIRPYESADREPGTFLIASPDGDPLLDARVTAEALESASARWRGGVASMALAVLALTLAISVPPLLRLRARFQRPLDQLGIFALAAALLIGARALLWLAPVERWITQVFRTSALGAGMRALMRSPADLVLTVLLSAALVMFGFAIAEQLRRALRRQRGAPRAHNDRVAFALSQLAAGGAVAILMVGYERLLGGAIAATSVDALHFSLHPWNGPAAARISFSVAIILADAVAVWTAVLAVQLVTMPWRFPRAGGIAAAAFGLRAVPVALIALFPRTIGVPPSTVPAWPTLLAGLSCLALAWAVPWVRPRYRNASQALRLAAGALVLLIPAFVLYPSMLHFADRGSRRLIEEEYAEQVVQQRSQLQQKLSTILEQIDRADLPRLSSAPSAQNALGAAAFQLWSETDLKIERLAASLELYAPDGALVSRFALNLPEYVSTARRWREPSCQWEIFEEASSFGSEERRLLHAGRGICAGADDAPTGGSIVVNVMLDYDTLPFITIRNPYYELIREPDSVPEGTRGRDIAFVAYGWGRGALYSSSGEAWPLDDDLLRRAAASRQPFWTILGAGARSYAGYVLNDRVGIYVIAYPVISPLDHLVNLSELATLVGLTYAALVAFIWTVTAAGGRSAASGREVLREVRASFYRKLFLAFLAASLVPVLVLAYATRAFFANQLRAGIESDAGRVAAVAQRVIEEYEALQQRASGAPPDDDIMVWLSRAIGEDVNIYSGPLLVATSERDLFDSGLLPLRTPEPVYRAIVLDRVLSNVSEEGAGGARYRLASAPVRVGENRAILTVPLALREQEVEREIDTLDRRVLLASLVFGLLAAAIGYYMAERIGDPVSRLTRATRRIARGDFSARIAQTSTDELRRLVDDFNSMAADLQRQQAELQRTHRLAAWAEMARQVAHEIKNPLTPIQLSSEHLLRVNRDRGRPLTPIVEECVGAIMSQVRLLREISAEFSSFASSPTPHPTRTSLAELVATVTEPYITGLAGRIAISTDVPSTLPSVMVDRTLLARALTNIIENALHAMPGRGSLTISGALHGPGVRLSLADTGSGMDPEAQARVFEPYFSTKATGTGLGLTIAKRNIELNGGRIAVHSVLGEGTVVQIDIPAASPASVPSSVR